MNRHRITRTVFVWLWLLSLPTAAALFLPSVPRALAVIPLVAAAYSLFVFLTRNRRD